MNTYLIIGIGVALYYYLKSLDKKPPPITVWDDDDTGLQYIGSRLGGVTPRLDKNGRHMRKQR